MKYLIYIYLIANIFLHSSCSLENKNLKNIHRNEYICDQKFNNQITKPNYIWHNDWRFHKTFKKINQIDLNFE